MKNHNKRERKLMRARNRDRINRNKKQQIVLAPIFIMVLITLDLNNLSPENALARLRYHILMLTGNANFPVIDPTLIQLQAIADELETAIDEAKSGDHLLIEHRNTVQTEAEDMIRSLALDIEKKSGKDLEKIHSSGFKTRKDKSPSVLPADVVMMYSTSTGTGRIKLRWKKIPNAGIYLIDSFTQNGMPIPPMPPNPGQWDTIAKSFTTTIELTDLNPGQMYYLRVYAINQVGEGNPSAIIEQRAL